jgi:hypothetical protein
VHEPGDDESAIDLVLQSADGEEYVLVLVENERWDVPGVIDRLAGRIDLCVAYVLDGRLAAAFPASAGKPVRVHVDHLEPLDTDVEAYFLRVADDLERQGLRFSSELLERPPTEPE